MKPIVIFGAGGFGREVLCLLRDLNRVSAEWDVLGFIDDAAEAGTVLDGVPVLGDRRWLADRDGEVHAAVALGSPAAKERTVPLLRPHVAGFPALVHPSAILGEYVRLGEGVIVTAGCILTSQVEVGPFAMINLACTVGHDATVGEWTTLSPGCRLSGHVRIGVGCDVGTSVTLIPGVRVGERSMIGAGGVVVRDIPDRVLAIGVPAKVVQSLVPAMSEAGG